MVVGVVLIVGGAVVEDVGLGVDPDVLCLDPDPPVQPAATNGTKISAAQMRRGERMGAKYPNSPTSACHGRGPVDNRLEHHPSTEGPIRGNQPKARVAIPPAMMTAASH